MGCTIFDVCYLAWSSINNIRQFLLHFKGKWTFVAIISATVNRNDLKFRRRLHLDVWSVGFFVLFCINFSFGQKDLVIFSGIVYFSWKKIIFNGNDLIFAVQLCLDGLHCNVSLVLHKLLTKLLFGTIWSVRLLLHRFTVNHL